MSRRDRIKDLYASTAASEKLAMANFDANPSQSDRPVGRVLAAPVRSMGLALDRIEQESKALQQALAAGATIVELDPDLVDESFVRDRLPESETDFERFKRSIAEGGQRVPILVRPHRSLEGRYEVAFGHRRTRACRALGIKVRAAVQSLSDRELVIAQGVENSERKDLSYIERSLYAARLEDRGFDRADICEALATDKGELSKLISVARAIPEEVVDAIGPAPKAGRRRWLSLADAMQETKSKRAAEQALRDPHLREMDSDTRFLRVFAAATAKQIKRPSVTTWRSSAGGATATLTRTSKATNLTFDQRTDPEFAEFVASQLDELHSRFLSRTLATESTTAT
jgi:ParB family transcriptional regulator, chromosome partitioning protein